MNQHKRYAWIYLPLGAFEGPPRENLQGYFFHEIQDLMSSKSTFKIL